MIGDELRQSFALLPGGSETRIRVSKPSKSRIKKFICGRSTPTSTLPVEGPTKNKLCRTIVFSSHSSEPMVDERGLSDPSPGNDCNDVRRMSRKAAQDTERVIAAAFGLSPSRAYAIQRGHYKWTRRIYTEF